MILAPVVAEFASNSSARSLSSGPPSPPPPAQSSSNHLQPNKAVVVFFGGQVVELGGWVPWEFQSEEREAPSNSEDPEEVVRSPPPGVVATVISERENKTPDGEKNTPKADVDGGEEMEKKKTAGARGEVCTGMAYLRFSM